MQALEPQSILINGVSYSWSDIVLSIAGGLPIQGITSIDFSYSRVVTNIYGSGSEPCSRGYGNKTYDASITLLFEEVQTLLAIAPNNDITQIPEFTIGISWMDDSLLLVTKRLLNCRFTNYDVKTKQNDTSIPITLKLAIAGIV